MSGIITGVNVGRCLRREVRTELRQKKNRISIRGGSIAEIRPGLWLLNWKNSEGVYHRSKIKRETLDAAIEEANWIMQRCNSGKGVRAAARRDPEPPADDVLSITIADAVVRAMENRKWKPYTRASETWNAEKFMAWVSEQGLTYWSELRFEHAERYMASLVRQGLTKRSIELRLLALKRTSFWMAANWPGVFGDFARLLESPGERHGHKTNKKAMPVHDVLDFCDYLFRHESRSRLAALVALQGLVGLSIMETLRLKVSDVDLSKALIRITGEVKNEWRLRLLPVAGVVAWLLRHHLEHMDGSQSLAPWWTDYRHYSKAIRRAMAAWDPDRAVPPKNLRKTIQTAAIYGGWYGNDVKRYVGHVPESTGERHYHDDDEELMIPYLSGVVDKIQAEIDSWRPSFQPSILPGPRLAKTAGGGGA